MSKKAWRVGREAKAEGLEGRVLLAVTSGEYATIRSTYADFGLPADMTQVNIIEITPDQLSVANLKGAITTANSTAMPDLVILRTTNAQNTITYASATDQLSIDILATQGAISIVGLGTRPLTLDAAGRCRVMSVGSYNSTVTVNLGGLALTRGATAESGGAIYQYYGTLRLENVTINGSTSELYGGGLFQGYGTSVLTNVVIAGNRAELRGGGFMFYDGTTTLTNATITRNITMRPGDAGGGLYVLTGTCGLVNTLVAGNRADEGADIYGRSDGSRTYLWGTNNLIGDGTGTSLANGVNGNLVGTADNPIDPKLAEGTTVGIGFSPLPGSPAIETGDSTLLPRGVTTDVYGAARVQGTRVNIGAVETVLPEVAGAKYVVTSLADTVAADGVMTLREALAAANSNQVVGDAPGGSYSAVDRIEFASGLSGMISTHGQAYQIMGSLALVGPGAGQLTLDAAGGGGVLEIIGARDVSTSGLTLTGGKAKVGGGISSYADRLTLSHLVISRNEASSNGGGVSLGVGGVATLTDVTITENTGGDGAGLYQASGTAVLTNVSLSNNTGSSGGGMYQYYGTSVLTNVTVTGNSASYKGGGLRQEFGASTLTNVVVSGNTASSAGGGLYLFEGSSTLVNVTISGNAASSGNYGYGGGLDQDSGTLTLRNTLIARNVAAIGPDLRQGEALTGTHSLIGDGGGQSSLVHGVNGNVVGSSSSPIDPGFVSMAGTDWRQWDLHLQATSLATNAGNNAWIPAGVTTDVAGGPRVLDGAVDIGAYEGTGEANRTPTDVSLSNAGVHENLAAGTLVGTLGAADPDYGDAFTYLLVGGVGSEGNGSFTIVGNELRTAAVFNYELKSSYPIRVRVTDRGGLWYEKAFTINVTDVAEATNRAPTGIGLSNSEIGENSAVGTVVGMLSATDPDVADTFTYSLVNGTGSDDIALFAIAGNELRTTASFDYEAKNTYTIRVRVTDSGSLSDEKVFAIGVTDLSEFGLQQGKVQRVTVIDGDGDQVTYSLSGGGSGTVRPRNSIALTGTAAKSVLAISVKKGANGDGYYTLGGIAADGMLKSISGTRVFVDGDIVLNTDGAAAAGAVAISLVGVKDGSIDTHGVAISSLKLLDWQDTDQEADRVVAPWIGSIVVSGRKDNSKTAANEWLAGDWEADVVTSSNNRGVAIGAMKVAGDVRGAKVWASGMLKSISAKGSLADSRVAAANGIGAVAVAEMSGSDVLVGVGQGFAERFATAGAFANPGAKLGKLTVAGRKLPAGQVHPAYVSNSHVSAAVYGTVTLVNVPESTGAMLHVFSDTGVLKVKSLSAGMVVGGTWKGGVVSKPGQTPRPGLVEVVL